MTDASAVVEYLLRTHASEPIRDVVEDPDVALHTVALCGVEIVSVLRRALLAGRLGEERARQALLDYRDLPLVQHAHDPLLGRILDLRNNFSAYDAAYAALAEAMDAELLTADARLRRAVREHLRIGVLEISR